jgi:two-component system nitrogen regulation response regulator NtrX
MPDPTALVVEDEPLILWLVSDMLREAGFHVLEAQNGAEARALLGHPFDVVLLDIRLPDANGLDLLPLFKSASPHAPVVVMSGHGTPEIVQRAKAAGADAFVHKPFDPAAIVRQLLEATRAPDGQDRTPSGPPDRRPRP